MGSKEYKKYLKSKHWQDVKRRFKESKLYIGKCFCCGSTKDLHLHHKSYRRLNKERLTDLIELCSVCHMKVHEMVRKSNNLSKTNLWSSVRKVRKIITKERRKKEITRLKRPNL